MMNRILIKSPLHVNGLRADVLIEGNKIKTIAEHIDSMQFNDVKIIDARNMAIIPGLINMHTHSPMSFFRGYGDDLDLMDWLNNMIWPVEAHMTPEDVYVGAKFACLEMIKSGTSSFLDMYVFPEGTAKAVEEMGLRANISYTLFDQGNIERAELDKKRLNYYLKDFEKYSNRIQLSVGPHAIYTVSGPMLQYAHDFAKAHGLLMHIHMSETKGEVDNCIKEHGVSPIRYLHQLGVLSENVVMAHALWLDSEEIEIIADYGVSCVHNPASNMKLASGYQFKYEEMRSHGIKVGIGTDGVSSSNNLDMFTAMKLASFLGKSWSGDPKVNKAIDIHESATKISAEILNINTGEINEGMLADIALIDLNIPEMTPCHDLISNIVYSANGSAVDTMIVDGKILMEKRQVDGEEDIINEIRTVTKDLFRRAGKV